ncbi:hypothetical protein RCL_jg25920.t1 [Rhizophagus clarus]|uniref:Uncharacterized protein n=1 Tax=Rhizophagus clarus TaxID=94130 RepID=A0A8H3QF72_9GLOM|nr:hypothetical protein RCL_jg25920.t1 [Rhizophagus clarus]
MDGKEGIIIVGNKERGESGGEEKIESEEEKSKGGIGIGGGRGGTLERNFLFSERDSNVLEAVPESEKATLLKGGSSKSEKSSTKGSVLKKVVFDLFPYLQHQDEREENFFYYELELNDATKIEKQVRKIGN